MATEKANLSDQLAAANSSVSASEVHGFITGWISSGAVWDSATEVFEQALETTLQGTLAKAATQTAEDVKTGLADMDFGFQVLLPEDENAINNRRVGLSEWCRGFLSGFGLTGRFQDAELSDEAKELLADFAQISQVDDEIPEDDENESDLTEITEYVRIGAVMIFTDCASKAVH
ncbi:MAG: hypothetical protein ACJAXW_001580 [Candidatus Azotimanducaceae bacterium]|jgi:uncharacterized protein YgfB (UPF0149 family)